MELDKSARKFGFRQQLAIIACYAAMFMLGFTISLLGPSLPGIAQRTGVTLPQAGLLFTLFSGGSILATLFVARLNDHPVRRWTFLLGVVLMGASLYLVSSGQTFAQVGVAIALAGLAMSTEGTVPNAIFIDLYRVNAGRALNGLHVFVGIGSFAGPLLLALVYRLESDYTTAYLIGAGLMVIVAILWLLSRPPDPAPREAASTKIDRGHLFPILLVLALGLLYTGTEQVMAGWLFTYGTGALGLAAATASLATSLLWGAVLGGRLSAIAALRGISNVRLVQVGLVLAASGVALILLGRGWIPLFWIGVALVGLGFGPIFPTGLALSSRFAADRAGAMASFFVAAGSIGAMILPPAAGGLIPLIGVSGSIAASFLPLFLMFLASRSIQRQT